eukprot:10586008-Alexandrium_andersonii.AAC.1
MPQGCRGERRPLAPAPGRGGRVGHDHGRRRPGQLHRREDARGPGHERREGGHAAAPSGRPCGAEGREGAQNHLAWRRRR